MLNDILLMPINKIKKLIGITTDTGATETTGTVMGKLNKVIDSVSNDGSVIGSGDRYFPKMVKKETILESEQLSGDTSSIFVWNDRVYYSDKPNKKVVVLDASTLVKLGETAAQEEQSFAIFVTDNILYYALYKTPGGKIVSFDATTLQKKAETTEAFGAIGSSRLFAKNGRLYVSDNMTKKLLVFDAVTLEKIGETAVQAGYASSLCVENNMVYYADSVAKRVIAFDAITLEQKGYTATQAGHAQRIVANGDTVFYADWESRKVVSFDANTLVKKGETIAISGSSFYISLEGDLLYAYSSAATKQPIYIFNADTLIQLKTIPVDYNSLYDIFATNVGLYVATSDYRIAAYIDTYNIEFYTKVKGVIE